MRIWILAAIFFASLAGSGWGQGIDVPSTRSAGLPMYRPILIGKGPESLIDRINTEDLVKKGQKDGLLMFTCAVRKTGDVEWSAIYGGSTDSDPLHEELRKRLSPASNQKFIPAIYEHRPVDAIYYGTVSFAVVNGKPRLRIFSNQELAELRAEHDFIGPQPFFGPESKFTGFHYPQQQEGQVLVDGVAKVQVQVDATGKLEDLQLISETPPFLGFGDAAFYDFRPARFIPAFRDGKPVACDVTLTVYYKAKTF